ncbi:MULTISPECIES: pyridoxal-phosphate dependent enzyme [Sorangium]|uniref:Serine/threonine dehydratase n=1 Tax=Sorangium cellulosum TaxID=56 RepID=A0A4P2QRW4_SORCE|nr:MULTISPECIES: pyridoxal-phosphate dependent enzyme [Sorangium]AUX32701.1 serine/threonine dehydratase [Sorangium cellulosum]WCQ92077.1 L-threo-3-hydroxyaspartate ammonia-lyase [Sorangium sp. Soce836]
MSPLPTIEDIRRAAARLAPHAHVTPVMTSRTIDGMAGARVFFKCENLQRVGAFKFRGACNAVLALSDEDARRGVATHSSGNHAAALALAARIRGVPAHIVMPESAPAVKRAAVEGYGARIVTCAPTLRSREETLARVLSETGAILVHPYNDAHVIAGQGTAALELASQVENLDAVVAPVGGGGLLSGTAVATSALSRARTVGAEPQAADDAARSLREGKILPSNDPTTIADGLRTSLGELTFAVLRERGVEIVTVGEEDIVKAMRVVWERMKILIEPSSAVPVAAVLLRKVQGARIGVILSGGNVDLSKLPFA